MPPVEPEVGTDYWCVLASRRPPIYVHAKLMIVDEECHRRVGGPEQRSLAGNRDSEIA